MKNCRAYVLFALLLGCARIASAAEPRGEWEATVAAEQQGKQNIGAAVFHSSPA